MFTYVCMNINCPLSQGRMLYTLNHFEFDQPQSLLNGMSLLCHFMSIYLNETAIISINFIISSLKLGHLING